MRCELCGASGAEAWCEWANLTGNYEDVNDYAVMCRRCHRHFDKPWLKRDRNADGTFA